METLLFAISLLGLLLLWLWIGLGAAGKELDHHLRFETHPDHPFGERPIRSGTKRYLIYATWTCLGLVSFFIVSTFDGPPRANLNWRWVNE